MTIRMFLQWQSSLLVRAGECLYFENGSSSEGSESQLLRQTGFPRCGKSTFCCRQVIHVMGKIVFVAGRLSAGLEMRFLLLANYPTPGMRLFCVVLPPILPRNPW